MLHNAQREDAGVVGLAAAPCDARIGLFPCGHQGSSASCARERLTYLRTQMSSLCSSTIIALTFSLLSQTRIDWREIYNNSKPESHRTVIKLG